MQTDKEIKIKDINSSKMSNMSDYYNNPILVNNNGVKLIKKHGEHIEAINAQCGCGCRLFVAPPIMNPHHKKRNPIMVCSDHMIHAYWFKDLYKGIQKIIQKTNDFQ